MFRLLTLIAFLFIGIAAFSQTQVELNKEALKNDTFADSLLTVTYQ